MNNQKKKIAIIDGNSWVHRAYHAVPPVMKLSNGTPTNACHGFMNMFLSFYNKALPDAIICAFDAGIPKFRLEAVSQYKAQRKPMDNELRVQFPMIEELLASMDIPIVKVDGWEGDDILGTLSAKCEKLGYESLLITGDKDANQLASELTSIVNMKKGVSEVVYYGPDEVFDKYGVTVDQFIDFLALMGDSSDNIPGVPGIGPKSAAKLLSQFGSLDGIYENLDKLKGKQLENIKDNKESAYISKQAAKISRDVPIDIDLEKMFFPSFDKDKLTEVFLKYQMKSSLTGVLKITGDDTSTIEEAKSNEYNLFNQTGVVNNTNINNVTTEPPVSDEEPPELKYENFLTGDKAVNITKGFINDKTLFSVAIANKMENTQIQTTLFDVSDEDKYKYPEYKNLLMMVSDKENTCLLESDNAIDFLVEAIKSGCEIVFENAKNTLKLIYNSASPEKNLITKDELYAAKYYDISLAAYLLNSSKSEYSAIDAYMQVFGVMLPTLDASIGSDIKKTDQIYIEKKNENIILRLARRANVTINIKPYIEKIINQINAEDLLHNIEIPLTKVLLDIEAMGAHINKEKLNKLSFETATLIEDLKSDIIKLAGEEFNIDSPKQLGHILFEIIGLPVKKKTKTGYSTAAEVLEELALIHELPAKVLEYREYAKIKSTYIDALPALTDKDELLHTTFHQRKTTTGRLSSSDPNIQNIPTRSTFGNKIRECFIPHDNDEWFMSADYSQIELRMLAHLSQDKALIEAFNSGRDFHSYTAANVFDVDLDDVTPDQRRIAKAVNFGIVYGQQAFGLSQTLKISVGEARDMINKYFETFTNVRKYLDEVVASATELGYAETMFGRRRYIPELNASNKRFISFGQRTAMNHPMQGSAADIIKIAMIDVMEAIRNKGLKSKCIMQVHDELDFSVVPGELDILISIVKEKMENAVKLDVPLIVDVSYGENWATAK